MLLLVLPCCQDGVKGAGDPGHRVVAEGLGREAAHEGGVHPSGEGPHLDSRAADCASVLLQHVTTLCL